jgi:hypothetical protein
MINQMPFNYMTSSAKSGLQLFTESLQRGRLAILLGSLFRRKIRLESLDCPLTGNGRDAGLKTVAISEIHGSESRTGDFDRFFHPLQERSRDRWIRILTAFENGLSLPPVELVRVGKEYYVRDGHHRLSVAAALGQVAIEAHVIEWAK